MPDKQPASKKAFSADWLMRGALTRIGDTFDRLTGRRWIPSSSLATSGLIDRLKLLMDAEARQIGTGTVVPHNIKLKMQWDKFSTDADDAMVRLETELLAAAADHINDSLYYTYAPLKIEVKRDYFTEGVKLLVSFEKFVDQEKEVELNVTVAGIVVPDKIISQAPPTPDIAFIARRELNGSPREIRLVFPPGRRLSVGRSALNGLALDDASVSKIHASLAINAAGSLCVADTGSTNGTFINNERISYGKAMEISESDLVKFGLVEVRFEQIPPLTADEISDHVDDGMISVAIPNAGFDAPISPNPIANDAVEVAPPNTTVAPVDGNATSPTNSDTSSKIETRDEATE